MMSSRSDSPLPEVGDSTVSVTALVLVVCAGVWLTAVPAAADRIAEPSGVTSRPAGAVPSGQPRTTPPDTTKTAIAFAEIIAGVVAAPNHVAEVVVPMTGRVVPLAGAAVGRHVTAGQKLTTLEPSYIMHDALHLINLRWPILQSTTDAKRRMLEAEAVVERLKLGVAAKAVSQNDLQVAEAAAVSVKAEYEQWNKTLEMHDAQINDKPAGQDIIAPIAGDIALASFTQGQLVYEGDPLFTIVDLTTVWIEVKVPEALTQGFKHETLEFLAPAFPLLRFQGRLQQVSPNVGNRTVSYFYSVANQRKLLRIGMLVKAAS